MSIHARDFDAFPIPPLDSLFGVLEIDHLGIFPLTDQENRHIVVAINYLTKWIEARSV